MSKSSFSNLSEFADTALGWAADQCFFPPLKQRSALFDLFFTRFGKTSRRAARAVRDFVTCSSPQSNGFSTEDVTMTSQESRTDLQDSQDETPSTTSNLQIPRDKPVRDVWSNRNGTTSPPHGFSPQPDFNGGERHPRWKNTHERVCLSPFSILAVVQGVELAIGFCWIVFLSFSFSYLRCVTFYLIMSQQIWVKIMFLP
jgi:hypothetical protein